MSIEVRPEALAETVEGFDVCYLLTVGKRPRPHVGAVAAAVADGVVRVSDTGRTAARDVAGNEAVTLLWAPREPDGYSLIVDGTATVVGDRIDVVPVRAVLHRPAAAPTATDGACDADCVELPVERAANG